MDDTSLRRATQIFNIDEVPVGSTIAEKIWRATSAPFATFTSVAVTHWEMVVMKRHGIVSMTIRGPETYATVSPIPEDAEFWGVQFRLGTYMPDLPAQQLVNRGLTLASPGHRSVWLNNEAWETPTFDNMDIFLRRLVRKGMVVRDPVVQAALEGHRLQLSERSVRRRCLRATGLTPALLRQIERAERAVALLDGGATILDVVGRAGYADQPHLTRSLKRFVGQTPAAILRERIP
jgi:hypothetical protein